MPTDDANENGGMDDLASNALNAARSSARKNARRLRVAGGRRASGPDTGAARGGYSGSGVDPRDPQRIGMLVRRMVNDRGWERTAASAGVMGRWEEIVGAEIADHARPESLRDGELVLVAESTAWATQLRLVVPRIQARLAAEVGSGVVKRIRVHGPAAPSWRKGPRRIAGRGPRDTYG